MSALTRILNNQIYNGTIIASQKIAAGTITGSLFSSNVTVPGDLLISGNLFVLGTSAYTTIASTNTYVNDPLITLNNGFSGTNTYDEGLIFNRGSLLNQAFIWNEFNKEFRLIGTTETGTTYGNVSVTNYANINLGNLTVQYSANVSSLQASGNITATGGIVVTGDLAVNGGDITTSAPIGNVFNATATTVNAFGAATTIGIGASTGTLTLNNATVTTPGQVIITRAGSATTGDGQIFLNGSTSNRIDWNTDGTGGPSLTTRSAGTKLVLYPALSGSSVDYAIGIDSATLWSSVAENNSSFNFKWFGGDIVVANLSGTGNFTTASGIVVNGTAPSSSSATGALIVKGGAGVAGNLYVGAGIQATEIGNVTAAPGWFTTLSAVNNLWANASIATTTQGTGAIVVPNGGISVAGAANIAGAITTAGAAQFNNTVTVGGISSFTNTTNSTDATGTTGALRIQGGASIAKDLWVGGNIYASNIYGVTQEVITVKDPLLYMEAGNTYPYSYDIGFYSQFVGPDSQTGTGNAYQHTGVVRDNADNTWKFFSNVRAEPTGTVPFDSDTIYDPVRAGNLVLTYTQEATSATTGALQVGGGAGIGGNIFHTGTQLQTSASNYIFATTPTTVDAFKSATDIEIGATSGTILINNPTLVGSQATQALYNTVASTINFGRAANITMGHTDGTTTLQGNANVRATTKSVTYTQGALVTAGGVGVAGNVSIASGQRLTIGTDLVSSVVYPENAVQVTTSANAVSRISIQNKSTGTLSGSELQAVADNGSNIANYSTMGIAGSGYVSTVPFIKALDSYFLGSNDIVIGSGTDIVLSAGLTSVDVRVSSSFSNVSILYSSESISPTSGALTVEGGVGINANLYVNNGAIINYGQSSEDFVVRGKVTTSLIRAVSDYGAVVIGGSNAAPTLGAVAKFNSTDSIHLPVGTSSQRPGSTGNTDLTGMLRFNTTINNLEFYDGTLWQTPGGTFTVITSRQFAGNTAGSYGNVDGTNTTFTLQSSSTTAATIVSINGVLQIPLLAYSVSGDTLTFTEPPAPGDIIDSRVLSTTVTVSALATADGYDQFIAEDGIGAGIWSGTNATIRRVLVDKVGNMNLLTGNKLTYTQVAVNAPATGATLIDSWSQSTYTTAKYVIQSKVGSTNVESYESMIMTDGGGNAYVSTYGIINNGVTIGTITANVVSGNVNVYYNTTIAQANVKAFGTFIV